MGHRSVTLPEVSRPRLRPHFDLLVSAPREDVRSRLSQRFEEGSEVWAGHMAGDHAQLVIRRRQRRFWSPWLTFALEPRPQGTLLRGRFAPHPGAWTFYIALYGMTGTLMLGLGFFGLSQWIAGEPPTMAWSVPIGAVVLVALYGSAFVGQQLSSPEMESMRRFVVEGLAPLKTEWLPPQPPLETEDPSDHS